MINRLTINTISFLLIFLFGVLATVNASPGDLDLTFSQDGISTLELGSGADDSGAASAIQPDGKIVVAGEARYGSYIACSVTRYNTDGSLDSSFDGDGKTYITLSYSFPCSNLAIQPDGKIVVIGLNSNSGLGGVGVIVRLNTNGSLDTTFNGSGILFGSTYKYFALEIQNDGKILTSGYTGDSTDRFTVFRFNTDGSPDNSFDGDGKVETSVGTSTCNIRSLIVQPDGKIVAAGIAYDPNIGFGLVRYNADGSLDTTFDGDGKVYTPNTGVALDVALQADGKIVAAGYTIFSPKSYSVVRYNADGSLDTSFDGDGKVTTSILNVSDVCNSVAVQADGKIVAAGSSGTGSGSNFSLVRYNSDGSLDNTFDGDGKLTTSIFNFTATVNTVAVQANGKILTAGVSRHGSKPYNYNSDTVLVRYNADGSLDSSFAGSGINSVDIAVQTSIAYAVAVQTDGKIITAATSRKDLRLYCSVTRYNADGSLDTTFDGDGIVETVFENGECIATSIAIQPDGKIVAAGYGFTFRYNYGEFVVIRYNTNGSLDTTFDGDGIATTSVLDYRRLCNKCGDSAGRKNRRGRL